MELEFPIFYSFQYVPPCLMLFGCLSLPAFGLVGSFPYEITAEHTGIGLDHNPFWITWLEAWDRYTGLDQARRALKKHLAHRYEMQFLGALGVRPFVVYPEMLLVTSRPGGGIFLKGLFETSFAETCGMGHIALLRVVTIIEVVFCTIFDGFPDRAVA